MKIRTSEWLRQSDYDISTAEYMLQGGRNIYAVFMCHLAIEKSLKGLYFEKLNKIPPKSHNLIYLLKEINSKPSKEIGKFIVEINEASVPTRYPEDLAKTQEIYDRIAAKKILDKSRTVIQWIKSQL